MTKQVITTEKYRTPKVPLSRGVKVGNLIFVSGMTPYNAEYQIAKGDFTAQMHHTMQNLTAVLEAAGSSLDKVVKVTVVLVRSTDFDLMNDIYKTYFKEGNYPARITFEAKLHNKDFLLEIECVAEV